MNNIRVKILKSFGAYNEGDGITLLCDGEGTPIDQYWRRRLKDAEADGCCEVVKQKRKNKEPS